MSVIHYTVSELMSETSAAIKERLGGPVWVDGEISGPRESRGHFYFDLVDRDDDGSVVAKVPVALWSRNRVKVEEKLRSAGGLSLNEGVSIRLRGPLEIWIAGGRLQLTMTDIDPNFTLEALESQREKVLAALRKEGLLDRNKRLAVPEMPTTIALITADESAAQADFLHSLQNSGLSWNVRYIDAKVQGNGAEITIAAAIRTAEQLDVDLIAVVRGGGSKLDLAVFDHELVARTIATCSLPVFTGIGHEIDISVADIVAHSAHKTPTACAEAIIDRAAHVIQRAEEVWREISFLIVDTLTSERLRLSNFAHRAALGGKNRVQIHFSRLAAQSARLSRAATTAQRTETARLDLLATRVQAVDPIRTLARGWSITRNAKGQIIRSVDDVQENDTVITTVADGSITTTVATIERRTDNA